VEVVALTSVLEDAAVTGAIKAGAIGYLLKDTNAEALCRAIKGAAAGQVQLAPEAAARLMREVRVPESPEALTERETGVLQRVARGQANKEIARSLFVEERDGQVSRLQHPKEARRQESHPGCPSCRPHWLGNRGRAERGVLVARSARHEEPRTQRRTPLRVLVVEDSEDDAQLIMRELERGGYKPDYERVETPKAMQEALASSEWDVIISDHRMPRFGRRRLWRCTVSQTWKRRLSSSPALSAKSWRSRR
jgi:DNA-binding NarL/FixJ family response regulator